MKKFLLVLILFIFWSSCSNENSDLRLSDEADLEFITESAINSSLLIIKSKEFRDFVDKGISNELSYEEIMNILIEEKLLDLVNNYSNIEISYSEYNTFLKPVFIDLFNNSQNNFEKDAVFEQKLRNKLTIAQNQNRFINHKIILKSNISQTRGGCDGEGLVDVAVTTAVTGCIGGVIAGGVGCIGGAAIGATLGMLAWGVKCAYVKIKAE